MGIAISLQQYLDGAGIPYEMTRHPPTMTAAETARISAIPAEQLAKGVLIRNDEGYLLAVVPASSHVRLDQISEFCEQPVDLASEAELSLVFGDCEIGCAPPVCGAYELSAVIDKQLEGQSDIYFEGGDHCTLVHLSGRDFDKLMSDVPHASISSD